ncbi:MAG: Na/Pi cotransporter family protein [Anaerovoracaceae bacterium]|nr:Na/Pi cotransporter family protein [Anaerovoracaceae bacterium]
MNQNLQMIITLLGGLAIFIYGMNLMSEGLQKTAGDRMRNILAILTRNPVVGVLAGAMVTAVLQSSSATTVMVIGFVSAGLMKLPQAVSVILGANIGTTVTAQLIAFKVGDYAWIFVVAGFVLFFFVKKEKVQNIGETIFAFGLLFVGINTMSETMKPLAQTEAFSQLMLSVADSPILGVVVGTLMTAVVQSSSAIIAVLQNLASTPGPDGVHSIIGIAGAIPILFGTNIGTTITAILASIGASVNAKRTALAHIIFNFSGTIIFLFFIPIYTKIVVFISPKGDELDIIARQIANGHLVFNIICTMIWIPFIWLLVKMVTKIISKEDPLKPAMDPIYLDYKVIETPVFAIQLAAQEIMRLGEIASEMIGYARRAFLDNNYKAVYKVQEMEEILNNVQAETVKYLSSLFGSESVTEHQATTISAYIHIAADIEHIGDQCDNIAEFAEEKIKSDFDFSDTAIAELTVSFDQIEYMMKTTMNALRNGDTLLAQDVLEQEKEVNRMETRLRKQHMKRLNEKKCSPEFTVIFTDIVHNIEKIGDYCTNIAQAVLSDIDFKDKKATQKNPK